MDGTVKLDSSSLDPNLYTVIGENGGSSLEVDFNNTKDSSAYQIQYSTAITDPTKDGNFVNTATLSSTGTSDVSTSATVTTSAVTPNHIYKTSSNYDPSTQTIDWTINYNGDYKAILDGTVLHDLFDNSQQLITDSVKVFHATVSIDSNKSVIFSKGDAVDSGENTYTVTSTSSTDKNGFDLTFHGSGNTGPYQITYQTKADGLVTADGNVNNSVTENLGAPVSVYQGVSQQGIKKTNTGADYAAKTTTWKLNVNGNNYQLNDAKIVDTFDNEGLTLQQDSFRVFDDTTGTYLSKDSDYVLTPNSDGNGFTVDFGGGSYKTTTDSFTITYTTNFDYSKLKQDNLPSVVKDKTRFYNTSILNWNTVEGDSSTQKSSTSTAYFDPGDYTKANGFKNGSYDPSTKEITWNIGIDYNNISLTNPIVTDQLNDGQKYVSGSLHVYKMNLTSSQNGYSTDSNEFTNYTPTAPAADNSNTLTVKFNSPINSPYYITFKTSLDGQIVNTNYNNTASFRDGTGPATDLSASVQPISGNQFVTKTGAQGTGTDADKVNWSVVINPSQSTITKDVVLKDNPSNNQILLPGSFVLYPATYSSDGKLQKGTGIPLTPNTDTDPNQLQGYTLSIDNSQANVDGTQAFNVQFDGAINSAYILEYQTLINANNGDQLTNSASLSGNNIQTITTPTSYPVTVKYSSGSATANGTSKGLQVIKKDGDNPDVSPTNLQGAEFELKGTGVLEGLVDRIATAGSDGVALFKNLKYGTYTLTETKAPNGYLNELTTAKTITIDSSSPTNSSGYVTEMVDDLKPVIFYKYDQDTKQVLRGAVYQLEHSDGSKVFNTDSDNIFTTNKYGNFAIDNLPEGDYQLVETKAPAGYQLNQKAIQFSITATNDPATTNTQIKIKGFDKIIPGSAQITKRDAVSSLLLAGATYGVYSNSGCTTQAKDNDGNLVADVTTGDSGTQLGVATINNLRPGTYYLKEKVAPTDYQLNTDPIHFQIALGQGENNPTAVNLTDTLKTGKVILTKVGEDSPNTGLQGAIFSLYSGFGGNGSSLQSGLTTNSDGKIEVDNLAPGEYSFVETQAPAGYVLNTEPLDFTIDRSQTQAATVTDTNSLKTGSVILNKVGEDNTNAGLQGAVYDFYNSNGFNVEKTTDTNGQIQIDGLKPGTYSYVEKTAPNDYQVDPNVKTFTIVKGQTQALTLNETDTLTPGSVVLTKYDSEDHTKTLQGATFELLGSDQTTRVKQNLTTDENGKISVDGLKPGTYYFKETQAPTNYDVNNGLVKVVIDKGQTTAESVNAYDTLTPGSAKLIKKAAEDHSTLLLSAEYKLVRLDSTGNQVWVKDHLVTDQFGQITVNDLAPGHYQFIETAAPANYQLDATPIDVTVAPGQKSVDDATVTAYDTLTPGDAHIIKTDALTGTVLSGAIFNVVDRTGATVRTDVLTGSDGTVTVSNLAPGNYQLVETKAPTGYAKSAQAIPFTIDKGQMFAKDVPVTDKMIPGSIELTKVDGAHPNNKLQGAKYQLLNDDGETPAVDNDGKSIDDQTTDKNGMLTFSNLRPGTYKLKEIQAPDGYQKNLNLISVTIKAAIADTSLPATKVTVQDYRGALKITKTDVSSTYNLPGAGALLTVTGPDGSFQMTTGPDGTATIGDLAPGDYSVSEMEAPEGYLVNTKLQTFTIDPDNQEGTQEAPAQVTFIDSSNGITLNKTNGSRQLEGAVFELRDSSGTLVKEDANGKLLQTSWTTDANGQINVSNLKTGSYQFIEVKAPNGYQVNTKPYTFTIKNTDSKIVDPLTATDEMNAVTLTKSDANDKNAVLAGAQFKLENSLGVVESDINGNALFDSWTTDAKGQFTVRGLPTGDYQFVETKAPNGYQLDATPIPFTVTNTAVQAIPVTATDKLNSITLTKVDKNDNNIHLQGAVFELQDSNGNAVTTGAAGKQLPATWTTDANGQFTVTGLAPGSYQFVETKAPANYDLDATPIPFTITNKDTSSQELTATDKLTAGAVQLTKVDKNDTNIHLQGATFKLEDSKGNAVTTDSDGKALPSTWTTDSNGLFTVGNLAPGDYQFIETKAPYGYDLDATPIPFTIAKSQQKAVEITATDSLTPGDVRLTKVDANDKNAVLKGAVFKLEDSKGNTLKTGLTTDSNGQFIVKGLAPGNYYFVETTAPTGYQLDDTPIPFTIEKAQAHAVEITATDKSKPIVLKGQSGVTYNIVDNDGHIIRRGVMADEQGNVIVEGLKPGSYHLVRAVEAYASSPVSKNLPTTGDTNDIIGVGAGVAMLLVGGLLAFLARRRND